jgi:hypothetical protein
MSALQETNYKKKYLITIILSKHLSNKVDVALSRNTLMERNL